MDECLYAVNVNYRKGYDDGEHDKVESFRQILLGMQCNGITEYGQGYNDCIKELWEMFRYIEGGK